MLKRRLGWEERQEGEDILGSGGSDSDTSSTESEVESLDAPTTGKASHGTDEEPVASAAPSKIKILVLSARGINARQRHLLDNFCALLPHVKKESKFDTKGGLFELNELAEMNGCTHCLFFEPKKPQELFIWAARCPSGPSVRFHVQSIATLEELHLRGNCMKSTRAILSFDPSFEATEERKIMRDLLEAIFSVPEHHRKTRPYFDHIFQFSWLDDRIWFRNYQVSPMDEEEVRRKEKMHLSQEAPELSVDGMALVEIGPRFVLRPVRVFAGSFGGPTIYKNPNFVPPSEIRHSVMKGVAAKYNRRHDKAEAAALRLQEANLPADELEAVFQ